MTGADYIVKAPVGDLRGVRVPGAIEFRAVPYAAPPTGENRWRPPTTAPEWSGIRDATSFGPDAMQRASPMQAYSRAAGSAEDCLYLNIAVPEGGGEHLPVMVWFHGGSFMFGSASDRRTDPAVFARDGVICISVGFRLGIFGFLAHPDLAAESDHGSAGNYSLLDQIAALRWIRNNIAAFGGNPDRITIFGVSSGGAAAALLLVSPLARGLFHQAILQSAGAFRPLAGLDQAVLAGVRLGAIADLRGRPSEEILGLETKLVPAQRSLTAARILRPIRDGWIIPADEHVAFSNGQVASVPTIVGSNADEGSRLVAGWKIDEQKDWAAILDADFGAAAKEAKQLYPAASDAESRQAIAALFGDTQFQLGARELARRLGEYQRKTYRYLFSKRRAGAPDGPHHGGEIPYVFGHLDCPPAGAATVAPDIRDVQLAKSIRHAWVRFAAAGLPGDIDGIAWPEAVSGSFLEFGNQTSVRSEWRERHLDFLSDFLGIGANR